MEFFCIGIQHKFLCLISCCLFRLLWGCASQAAFTCRIINLHARLAIINKDIKADAFPFIFYRISLHPDAPGNQIFPFINRSNTVQNMVVCFLYIFCHLIFKRKHPIHIHIACPSNQVLFIRIFTGKLEANQMAAVI